MGARGLFYGWVVVGASALIVCIGMGALFSLGVFLKPMADSMGWSRGAISSVALLNWIAMGLGSFFWGALSDRIGRRASMIAFGALSTIGTLPILHALRDVTNPYAAFGLIVLALAIISLYTSISGLIKAEMFPPQVRALGVGLSYALANAAFGGTAEYVALWLKNSGAETVFYGYVTVMTALALLVALKMRDPSRTGYLRDEP